MITAAKAEQAQIIADAKATKDQIVEEAKVKANGGTAMVVAIKNGNKVPLGKVGLK